ncbi:restriction endonuclease subunit S [Gloeocapsa sp. PCC 73106]|uniref:restriction endonuclease subunit S n=1 Tax=Gloeocapsa sp. PCC 73106 TaxID=102232 RepID=UPI0002ABEC35|nr:restriction endonuclease subunit S [Gloeocapsa sp. PCC 73106]ELR96487.1 type I restriction modification DNA specificity protein [Gloeocapsa sp. PCC 73106]
MRKLPKSRWSYESLDKLCEIVIGRTPSRSEPKYWGKGNYWLSIADMGKNKELTTTKETITDEGADVCGKRLVTPGTIVFSFKLSIGKVGIIGCPMFTNEAIAALPIKDESILNNNYLYYILGSLDLTEECDRAVKGRTLNKSKLAKIQI